MKINKQVNVFIFLFFDFFYRHFFCSLAETRMHFLIFQLLVKKKKKKILATFCFRIEALRHFSVEQKSQLISSKINKKCKKSVCSDLIL
jgi:hypothetical protein